jgi:hypothetical protein
MYMIVTPTLQRLNRTQIDNLKPKGKSSKIQSDAEDELPDAPPRRAPREDDDIALHEAIANVLVSIPMGHRSRRSSTASWSSGHDLRVPDTDPDDEDDEDNMGPPAAPVKVNIISRCINSPTDLRYIRNPARFPLPVRSRLISK